MAASIGERLDALYARVPAASPCPARCRECCGPIPMTKTEWARIERAHPHAIAPRIIADGMHIAVREVRVDGVVRQRCPFVRESGKRRGCTIYDQRPLMCRMFAASLAMTCPLGRAASTPLSPAEHEAILTEYHKIGVDDR
jgi:Fe-S-cluster containining protein